MTLLLGRQRCLYWEALSIELPKLPLGHYWYQIVDTYEEKSISNPPVKAEYHTVVRERSVVVFQAGAAYE